MTTSALALKQFLEEHRIVGTGDRRHATVTGMSGGKYHIDDEEYPKFMDLVHDYIHRDSGRPMNLIEQPRTAGPKPLVIDLDFRYRKDRSLTHPFNNSHIQVFLEKLVEGLNTFFDLDPYEQLRFFVSLRPQGYENKGEIKDGIHVQCPDIVLSFEKQGALRRWMLNQDAVNDAFKDTGFTNQPADIYDESCTRKQGWFLYGESKQNIPAYTLSHIPTYTPSSDRWSSDFVGNYDNRELIELLSVYYNIGEDDNEVKEDVAPLYTRLTKDTPQAGGAAQQVPAKAEVDLSGAEPTNILVKDALEAAKGHVTTTNFEDLELVKALVLECLSVDRADNYNTWKRVGWCLHNINPSEEMFDLWMEFSARSPKFAENDVGRLRVDWLKNMRHNKDEDGRLLTIRSLRYWAREDNPTAYKVIMERDLVNYVLHNVLATHYHVAKLMKRMFQDNYVAACSQRNTNWYEFVPADHRWRRIDQGIVLRNHIATEVVELLQHARHRYKSSPEYTKLENYAKSDTNVSLLKKQQDDLVKKRTELREANRLDEALKVEEEINKTEKDIHMLEELKKSQSAEVCEQKLALLAELETKLYNSGFKDSVMKECVGLFYEEGFEQKLNGHSHRIGCANGVIHLDRIKPSKDGLSMVPMSKAEGDANDFFEDGRPEDYITFQSGAYLPDLAPIPYIPYDPADPAQREIDDFFVKLFPRADLREWMDKRLLPSCLEGKNREQCYFTFKGVGGNGKSKLVDLMTFTMGDYQTSLQSTALTRKRPESGAANPDIMSIKNKRFIYMQEPDDRESLNTSRMKQFSGEDAVEARGLFQDQERFKVTGKLFMMCNEFPPINSMDRGTWRRIRVVPFESLFVKPGAKEIGQPNVYLQDMMLDAKLKRWRVAFFSRLVHNYVHYYAAGGLEPMPPCVMEASNRYKEDFDVFAKFVQARIRKDNDAEKPVTMPEIWRAYRYWVEGGGGTGKKLTQNELTNRCNAEYGEPRNKKWLNLILFDSDDKVEEYDDRKRLETAAREAKAKEAMAAAGFDEEDVEEVDAEED